MDNGIKTIEKLAKRGEQHDIVDALKLLVQAYMDMCGISAGYRTVVFYSAKSWQEKLAWLDLPLSELARKNGLTEFMPYIVSEYAPEIYDNYDIAVMDNEELLACCKHIIDEEEFDEPTTEVLCWGLLKATEEKEELSQEIETVAYDGTVIKSDYYSQNCGSTFVTISFPHHFCVSKKELVQDLKGLMTEAYTDYQRLHNMENEVRALYPRYQAELAKCKDASEWEKRCAFRDVYSAIISTSIIVLSSMAELFNEWWGLEFYTRRYR